MTYEAIDCQGFAGGFTLGMAQAGFTLIGKREHAGGFGVPNCEVNRHLLGNAWQSEVGAANTWSAKPATVVFGNPPCSGFSIATDKRARGINAKINSCMWDFVRFAARCNPTIAVFESVRSAFSTGGTLMTALREELERLTGNSYTLYHVMHNAYDLGGVAIRPRYFWVASQIPFGVEWPMKKNDPRPTFWDAISDLEPLQIQWEAQPYRQPASPWAEKALSPDYEVDGHQVARHNPHQERLTDLFKFAHEVGGWREGETMHELLKRMYETLGYVPPAYEYDLDHMLRRNFVMGFISPRRWISGNPARVIDGASLDRAIHPTLDRCITHREAARVMGFPDNWLIEPLRDQATILMKTWGKGITVQCGKWIGNWIRAALDGQPGSVSGTLIGDRQYFVKQGSQPVVRSLRQSAFGATTVDIEEPIVPRPRKSAATKEEPTVTETTATEANAEAPAAEATPETTEAAGRRGRPRPQLTLERDAKVLDFLNTNSTGSGEFTIEQISDAMGGEFARNVVRACLDRLSWGTGNKEQPVDPQVEKTGRRTWRSVSWAAAHQDDIAAAAAKAEADAQAAAAAKAEAAAAKAAAAPAATEQAAPVAEPEAVPATSATWE